MRLKGVPIVSALLVLLLPGAGLTAATEEATPEVVSAPAAPSVKATTELAEGQTISRQLSNGTMHTYRLNALPGEYVRVLVTKRDLNLHLTASGPAGQPLRDFVSWRYGPLRASFIVASAGAHLLEVRSLEGDARDREYSIHVEAIRAATDRDRKDDEASTAYAEAERLRAAWTGDSLRAAVEHYVRASEGWKSCARPREAATALSEAGDTSFMLSEYRAALDFYRKARRLSQGAGDQRAAMRALNSAGYVHVNTDDNRRATSYFRRALNIFRRARPGASPPEDLRDKAQTINNLGEAYYYQGDLGKAKKYFNRALAMHATTGDRRGQALAHLNLGYTFHDSGDLYNSEAHLSLSLSLSRAVGDRRGEAQSITAQAMLLSFRGEKQRAFDAYKQASRLFRAIGDKQGEAAALNSVGKAYEDLNEPFVALDHYVLALGLFQQIGNHDAEAVTKYYLGRAYRSLGEDERALGYYGECLSLSRALGKRRVESYALTDISSIHARSGQQRQALDGYGRVLRLYSDLNDRRGRAHVLASIADVHLSSADRPKAVRLYRQSLALSRGAGDQRSVASTLYKIARAERDAGDLDKALGHVKEALEISESLRTKVARQDLRSSYFASAHEQYSLYVDLLMRMHARRPSEGFDIAALEASESARARTLLEILAAAHLDVRQGVDVELLDRERSLQQSLAAKAESHVLLRAAGSREKEAGELEQEVRRMTTEYQEVVAEIREQGLRRATVAQPRTLRLGEIQAELLDADTLLLEYALGDERSYLWVVSSTSLASYELPPKAEIEAVAREVYRLLAAYQAEGQEAADGGARPDWLDEQYWRAAADMSRMLLGPAAAQLGRKKLLVVADGALQYIPFDALPAPAPAPVTQAESGARGGDAPAPLVLDHEVVSLPSATTLASLRRKGAGARAAPGKLVVALADPVFEPDDPRFRRREAAGATVQAEQIGTVQLSAALRSVDAPGGDTSLSRLPFTLQEAKAIMEVTPAGEGRMVTDFAASRSLVVGGGISDYRVVHFATHGMIDGQHPEMSGIVLSMLNEQRGRENGFLQLHDIYGLRLSADLVVLSACRTGLGKEIRGEGLVGLTQGFLHGGARSVVASLWRVDDRATAELMRHFYRAMFKEGLPPAAALRQAKQELWRQRRWHSPYYWAGFVLQGEYRDSLAARPETRRGWAAAFAILILLTLLLIMGTLRKALRKRRAAP